MKECFVSKNFKPDTLKIIVQANRIIADYMEQGFKLTLRQLYYQFVARDLIPNKTSEYKRLGSIVNDARLAGLIDWNAIEDRTRNLEKNNHWSNPKEIVDACVEQYQIDRWFNQPRRVEVWIEKEALAGIFEKICKPLDIPFLCCRGYLSQSEMYSAANRLSDHCSDGQEPVVLHFGDHDPSGIDMTRDNRERIVDVFSVLDVEVRRLALNIDQIQEYNPPPNPAKETDSRFAGYIRKYGDKSWELDALEPAVLKDLVEDEFEELCDPDLWKEALKLEKEHISKLKKFSETL